MWSRKFAEREGELNAIRRDRNVRRGQAAIYTVGGNEHGDWLAVRDDSATGSYSRHERPRPSQNAIDAPRSDWDRLITAPVLWRLGVARLRHSRPIQSCLRTVGVERFAKVERIRGRPTAMQVIDAIRALVPSRHVIDGNPPRHIGRPRATHEPVRASGECFSVHSVIRVRSDRFEVLPEAQRHRVLLEWQMLGRALGPNHRSPGVLPGLDVADRAREEAGAAFGRGVIRGEAIHESLHLWMANRLLEDAKRHERDSLHRDRLCERCKSDQQRLHRIPESGVQRHFRW
jgi:hypothetical protein